MSSRKANLLKAALAALHYSRADGLIAPFTGGAGAIFMLHHVTPEAPQAFSPNRILKVTPDFLESVIAQVRAAGFDIIAMDDVRARLSAPVSSRPFVVFTLDDGYKDNRDYAYPVFKRLGVPFTVYVPSDFADGRGELWWLLLERALARLHAVSVTMHGRERSFPLATVAQKITAYDAIYWWLRRLPENEARGIVRTMATQAGLDIYGLCRELVMNWDELRALARDPLVTIGAHTLGHYAVAKLPADEARRQMAESAARIEAELGTRCRHFSFPYGSADSAGPRDFAIAEELGFESAVTTRKGLLHSVDAAGLCALPRVSLNGDYQDNRYVKVLLSGAPFALMNMFRRGMRPAASMQRA